MHKLLILLFISVAFIGCSTEDELVDEFKTNRQLWESSGIVDYQWRERLSCECGGVLLRDLFVVGGIKEKVEFDESQLFDGYTYQDVLNSTSTVEEAFNLIESLLSQHVASLYVAYDANYGFPTMISIDYDRNTIDDEIAFMYSNFEISLELH